MNVSQHLPVRPTRSDSVVMGRQGYLSVVLRLVGMELYKLRRRLMSKVLGILVIVLAVLPFALVAFGTFATANAPAGSFGPPCQSQQGSSASCPSPSPAQVKQERQVLVENTSSPLRLPVALNVAVQYGLVVGIVLLVILVGTITGGEYGTGTIRLLFIRGPTRTQFLLGKLGATLVVIFMALVVMTALGILTGQLFNPVSGIAQSGDFLNGAWVGHALLYLLIALLNWFMFAAIALFFATLGRSTVAGVVAGISWLFAEPIVGSVLTLLGNLSKGALGDVLRAIPNYFIGSNFSALYSDQGQYLSFGVASTPGISVVHAVLVLLVYFAFFLGLTWWINKRRDVTN